jgi:hypothetical protein
VRIPDEWKERMARSTTPWSEVLRSAIAEELARLEREEVLQRFLQTGNKRRSSRGSASRSIREDRDGR